MAAPLIFDRERLKFHSPPVDIASGRFFLDPLKESLKDRLACIKRSFISVLILGAPLPYFKTLFSEETEITYAGERNTDGPDTGCILENETLPFQEHSFDLVLAPLFLHHANDIPGLLIQIKNILKPDGLFLSVFYGGDTLHELQFAFQHTDSALLKGISPHIHPMIDLKDYGHLLQRAGFVLPVVDCEKMVFEYDAFDKIFKDLKALGEENLLIQRKRGLLTPRYWQALERAYSKNAEGFFPLSVEMLYGHAWAPGPNQPQPLKPGSATASLTDIL